MRSEPSDRGRERGAALLEAALALGLVALIAGAGLTAFSRAAESGAAATARLEALAAAENALERASAAGFLARALEGDAEMAGEGWRVTGAPYVGEAEGEAAAAAGAALGDGPLALIHLRAEAGPEGAPLVTLETLRTLPR